MNILKLFLKHGSAINKRDENEITLLHLACKKGKSDIVKLLSEFGVSTNKCSKSGETPLHCLCYHDDNPIEQSIINGLSINEFDKSGDMQLVSAKDSTEDVK